MPDTKLINLKHEIMRFQECNEVGNEMLHFRMFSVYLSKHEVINNLHFSYWKEVAFFLFFICSDLNKVWTDLDSTCDCQQPCGGCEARVHNVTPQWRLF